VKKIVNKTGVRNNKVFDVNNKTGCIKRLGFFHLGPPATGYFDQVPSGTLDLLQPRKLLEKVYCEKIIPSKKKFQKKFKKKFQKISKKNKTPRLLIYLETFKSMMIYILSKNLHKISKSLSLLHSLIGSKYCVSEKSPLDATER